MKCVHFLCLSAQSWFILCLATTAFLCSFSTFRPLFLTFLTYFSLQRRQKAARLARFTTVSTSVASDLPDILDALHRMDAAFSLVIPDVADGFLAPTSAAASSSSAPISADADDASLDSLAKQLGLGSSAYRLSIEVAGGSDMFRSIENADNSAVFDTLRESALLLQKSMLPRVRGWLAALRDSESVDAGEHERLVKRLVDVQGHVQDAMQRCDVLAVNQQFYVDPSRAVFEEVPEEDEEEEAGEEEGESAGTESSVVEKESETAETASKSTENASKSFEIASTSTSTSTSEVAISPSVPSPPRTVREGTHLLPLTIFLPFLELLASAPVIPFAADLAHWDATMRDIESATIGHGTPFYYYFPPPFMIFFLFPANFPFLFPLSGHFSFPFSTFSFPFPLPFPLLPLPTHLPTETMYENPWFRFKDEVSLPQELLDARFKRAVQWKPAEREYPPCRARLPGGISLRLCDRRDAHVCPFHGPIVPRDDNGDVIEEEEELSQNQGQSQPQTEASVPGEVREVEFDGHVTEAEAESAGRRLRPAREVTAAEAAAAAARLVGEADAAKKKKGKGKKRKEEDAFRRVLGGSMSKRARAVRQMMLIKYKN